MNFEKVRDTIAAAFEYAADIWMGYKEDKDVLRKAASDIRVMKADDSICNCCDEIICDDGCPFNGLRTTHGT